MLSVGVFGSVVVQCKPAVLEIRKTVETTLTLTTVERNNGIIYL